MTSTCLSELHIVPQKTSINADYYQENILEKNLLPMFDRRSVTGSLTGRKCPEIKSEIFFYARRSSMSHCCYIQPSNGLRAKKSTTWGKLNGPQTPQI